ncbi:hypothetical protein BDV93DRAFT_525794 [Ceratobasidium sp. AG-I]|nr:hypothetical protein BDV93DRAFT_525794 [Ceratobasidium sp. AG-I]
MEWRAQDRWNCGCQGNFGREPESAQPKFLSNISSAFHLLHLRRFNISASLHQCSSQLNLSTVSYLRRLGLRSSLVNQSRENVIWSDRNCGYWCVYLLRPGAPHEVCSLDSSDCIESSTERYRARSRGKSGYLARRLVFGVRVSRKEEISLREPSRDSGM